MPEQPAAFLTAALRDPDRYEVMAHPATQEWVTDEEGRVRAGVKVNKYLPRGHVYVIDKSFLAFPPHIIPPIGECDSDA